MRDPALSEFLLEQPAFDETCQGNQTVQSVIVMLANQFATHSQAVDVELLLDVLALPYPELRRVDNKGVRKRIQQQLDWADGLTFLLEAQTGAAVATADKVTVSTLCLLSGARNHKSPRA